ncbi:MAG: glycosyltransferase, partial [Clostridiales bacterium]
FCDDQWRFDTFTKYLAPKLTYSITTDKYSLTKYESLGYKNVILSQWGALEYDQNINFSDIKYKYEISFVGGRNSTREWIINHLKRKGIKVECFGKGWENGRISYEDMRQIFLQSKINLNLSNSISTDIRYLTSSIKNCVNFFRYQKRIEQIKARNFEIPCFGGFQLTNYVPGIEEHYVIGDEVAVYSSVDDLCLQLDFYLKNDLIRQKIAVNGYERSQNYTYTERIKEVLGKVNCNAKN